MEPLKLLFVSLLLITLSCSKEDSGMRLSEFETPVVTGFELRDIQGIVRGYIGTPNVKLGNESNHFDSEYYFVTYPNPCRESCVVYGQTPDSNETKYVWIVQAQYIDNSTNSTTNIVNAVLLGSGGAPLIQSEFSSNNILLDLSGLSPGYYRIYLKVADVILYDNLIVTNN